MKEDDLSFRIPIPNQPAGKPVTLQEAEKLLLQRLQIIEKEREKTLYDLAILYSRAGRQELSMAYINRLLISTDDPEKKADYYLSMGQLMEQVQNFDAAIDFYKQAFSLEPANNDTWYFVNNNLGYCLNIKGQFQEAETYCRAAIKINSVRHNAYKNLGISLEGQGFYPQAAEEYIRAVQANSADPRAFHHLEELVAKHSDKFTSFDDIQNKVRQCKEAVETARNIWQKGQPDKKP